MSLRPNGIGLQKPNHFAEMARTVWENKHALPYAWRILSQGVCDGCALGVAGFHDWTIDGVHLCTTRLNLLKLNTMRPDGHRPAGRCRGARAASSSAELRELGRLPYPMLRRRGEPGFSRDHAGRRRSAWSRTGSQRARAKDAADGGDRLGFFLTARGITNEVYYVAQKVARFLGTNSVDNAARICHAPSTNALKDAIGVAATTVSYTDVIESDLIVIFGADVANAQPVFMKYLYMARKRGARIVVVNPMREPGLERYWVPSNPESALFGTQMATDFFEVNTGGDIAFLTGVLKVMADEGLTDDRFIREHTTGWGELRASLADRSLEDLARWAGSTVEEMTRFAHLYAEREDRRAGVVDGHHPARVRHGQRARHRAPGLARGNVGRPGAGLMPIRGHSGVQGGAEMGAYATVFPGGVPITPESAAALEAQYGFPLRTSRGSLGGGDGGGGRCGGARRALVVGRQLPRDAARPGGGRGGAGSRAAARPRGHRDQLPDARRRRGGAAAARPDTLRATGRLHRDDHRATGLLQPGDPRPGHRRGEGGVADLPRPRRGGRPRPGAASLGCGDAQAIRDEIARVVPFYDGIQHLAKTGDQVQWGGERLCDGWVFPTHDGKAHFQVVAPRESELPAGRFWLSTRRGKQFNSMVWKRKDPLDGRRPGRPVHRRRGCGRAGCRGWCAR